MFDITFALYYSSGTFAFRPNLPNRLLCPSGCAQGAHSLPEPGQGVPDRLETRSLAPVACSAPVSRVELGYLSMGSASKLCLISP